MRKKENILNIESRREIYNLISKSPGLHLHEISRRLNIPITTLRYHLRFLKKRDLITKKSEGGYVRYYAINKIGSKDKKLLNLLRNKTVRLIVLLFYWEVAISRVEISKLLNIHPNTVGFHLKKLLDLGIIESAEVCDDGVICSWGSIIERSPVGREKIYRFKNVELMWDILVTYQRSFLDDFTEDMLGAILCHGRAEMPKRHKAFESQVDFYIGLAFEIFPHPYHV